MPADIRQVTPRFAVAPQIALDDIASLPGLGFGLVICNRPDGEQPGQPTHAEFAQACEAAGLAFVAIPFSGAPGTAEVEAMQSTLASAQGSVLAFCRSGTRSITVWALAQARAGHADPDELVALASKAGYDLSGWRPTFKTIAEA